MVRYEYLCEYCWYANTKKITQWLNLYANSGWELWKIYGGYFYFRREVQGIQDVR